MSGEQAAEPRMWPQPETKIRFAQKCDFTNYSELALSAVTMSFDLVFKESVMEEGRPPKRHSGNVVLEREHPIEIPVMAREGTFVLYVQNASDLFVDVFVPEIATVLRSESPIAKRYGSRKLGRRADRTFHSSQPTRSLKVMSRGVRN